MLRQTTIRALSTSLARRPQFELYDIREVAEDGKKVRFVCSDTGETLMSIFPQLGPRKTDPNDVSSQFDDTRRVSTRFTQTEIGFMLGVLEGKIPSARLIRKSHDLEIVKLDDVYGIKISGKITRPSEFQDISIVMERLRASTLRQFLSGALDDSFGFTRNKIWRNNYRPMRTK